MQAGKYDLAREAYTASLGVKATHLAFANRAMASLKLRDFAAAEADCTSAIELEPRYIKVSRHVQTPTGPRLQLYGKVRQQAGSPGSCVPRSHQVMSPSHLGASIGVPAAGSCTR